MKLLNLKHVWKRDVGKWLLDTIPELTEYQKEKIKDDDFFDECYFEFYETRPKANNIFIRCC